MEKGARITWRPSHFVIGPVARWSAGLSVCRSLERVNDATLDALCLSPQSPAQPVIRGCRPRVGGFWEQASTHALGVFLHRYRAALSRSKGMRRITRVPWPDALSTATAPPCSSAMRLTIASPRPLPPSPVAGATLVRAW